MSFAQYNNPFKNNTVLGCFREKDYGHLFEFGDAEHTPFAGYNKMICVANTEYRYCQIKKTVAYVIIDEDANGNPVVDKWNINSLKMYVYGA